MSELTVPVNRGKSLILVVDDDQFMRTMFQDALLAAGYEVALAEDGDSAVGKFASLRPDLVLLDMVMRGKDGGETCRDIRSLPGGEYTPVFLTTSVDSADSIHRAFECGATDFIAKPVNTELLLQRVLYALRSSRNVKKLAKSQARLEMLKVAVDNLQIGITFSDVNGVIVYSNPAEAAMHGYTVDELIGKEARKFSTGSRSKPLAAEQFKEISVWRRESVNVRKNGEEFPAQLTSIPVLDKDGRCLGLITTCEDISEKKITEQRMHKLAFFDTLTGLPNREMFLNRLHQSLAHAQREQEKVNLIFLDLDNFKNVNDTQGHEVGDKLLRLVSDRLSSCMRESDVLGRLGGDEFVVVCPTVASQESVAVVVKRIQAFFEEPFEIDGRQIYTSASMGIAVYPDDCQDASTLFRCADTAMYQAKNEGKAQFRFFSNDLNQKIMARVALENSLRRAIENQEFLLNYQPLWDLKSGRMAGVEALLRWQSADYGLMQPATFIPVLEDTGMIVKVGEWVLRTACFQLREWTQTGHSNLKMAVNVSGKQMKHPRFVETLTDIVVETGIDPRDLELEFTESVIMDDVENTVQIFGRLKNLGIKLSIDDFGTGYSSLNYLKHFPVDRIKIDRSFVADLSCNTNDAAIIEAIVSMAQSLSLLVVAEGVETDDQLRNITTLGCDEVQGYYLARPMHADAVAEKLGTVHGKHVEGQGNSSWHGEQFAGQDSPPEI